MLFSLPWPEARLALVLMSEVLLSANLCHLENPEDACTVILKKEKANNSSEIITKKLLSVGFFHSI